MSPTWDRKFTGSAKEPNTRTARATKYYFIDFGIARQCSHDVKHPREDIILGGDKTVPEFQNTLDPQDPFPTDIYYIGNMMREDLLQQTRGLEFMRPLVDNVVQDDPTRRPTIDEVVVHYREILRSLHWWKLRSRLVENIESFKRVMRPLGDFIRKVGYVLTFKRAIPAPRY